MKDNHKAHRRAPRDKSSFEAGLRTAPISGSGRYANRDISCRTWGDRIDLSVCITRSTRHPEQCAGCPRNF